MRALANSGNSAAAVGAAVLAISTIAFFRVALLPAIGRDLALRPSLVSLVTVVFGAGRLLTDVPAGRLADRVPALRALAGAGVVIAAGSFLLAGAHSLAAALGAAAVLGVASSVANTTGMTHFSHAPAARRGKSMAIFSAALLGGQSLGPAVSGVLSGPTGWRGAEVVAGGAALVLALVVGAASLRAAAPAHPAERRAASAPTPALSRLRRGLLYTVPFSVFFALGAMPQTLVPLIGARAYGLSAGAIGLALGLGGACRFAGAAAGGVISDRLSRKAALVPGLALMAGGIGLLEVHAGAWVWVAAVVLMSLGSFGVTVAATMLADLGGGARVGRRLGTFRFVGDAGLIAGPLVAGFLYDRLGTGAAVAAVGGLLVACAAAAALLLPETRHAESTLLLEPAA